MKFLAICFLTVCLSAAAHAQAQDPHVHSEYMPKYKLTKVETDMLFVSDSADQFMQIGFVSRYPNQQPVTPPKSITITMYSNSPKPLYEKTKSQNLTAITDGNSWKVGEFKYWLGKGSKGDKGVEMFASDERPGLGLQNPLPPNARVSQGRDVDHLYLEWLIIDLKPEQFAQMAQARKLEFQIGTTKFQFSDSQMETIRAFAASITPK